jgi:hypothetical protein
MWELLKLVFDNQCISLYTGMLIQTCVPKMITPHAKTMKYVRSIESFVFSSEILQLFLKNILDGTNSAIFESSQ